MIRRGREHSFKNKTRFRIDYTDARFPQVCADVYMFVIWRGGAGGFSIFGRVNNAKLPCAPLRGVLAVDIFECVNKVTPDDSLLP